MNYYEQITKLNAIKYCHIFENLQLLTNLSVKMKFSNYRESQYVSDSSTTGKNQLINIKSNIRCCFLFKCAFFSSLLYHINLSS